MASKNVETVMGEHEAFNRRDFSVAGASDDIVMVDTARNLTLKGKGQAKEWLSEWVKTFSNGRITEPQYIDAGDTVVSQFVGTGTQDGPLGPFPPTGKDVRIAFCEIARFNAEGKIVSITNYYDQLSLLAQLGHLPAPK
jgi:predicted ester cyclase